MPHAHATVREISWHACPDANPRVLTSRHARTCKHDPDPPRHGGLCGPLYIAALLPHHVRSRGEDCERVRFAAPLGRLPGPASGGYRNARRLPAPALPMTNQWQCEKMDYIRWDRFPDGFPNTFIDNVKEIAGRNGVCPPACAAETPRDDAADSLALAHTLFRTHCRASTELRSVVPGGPG